MSWHSKKNPIFTDAKEQPCDVRTGESVCTRGCAGDAATCIVCCHQIETILAVTGVTANLCSAGSCCPPVCHCALSQAHVCASAEVVLGDGSETEGLQTAERVWLEGSKVLAEVACGQAAETTYARLERRSVPTAAHGEAAREALSASGRACR